MRIKSLNLKNYKRFTDLSIRNIPEDTRLVVLIGPNGSGKSSVFDSFLLKTYAARGNYRLSGDDDRYYEKILNSETTHQVAARIKPEFHHTDEHTINWQTTFNIRSAYRNESDFSIGALEAVQPSHKEQRFQRIIDQDLSVSENYRRLAWKRMSDLDRDAPSCITFGDYRRESLKELQNAMQRLFEKPTLVLQDFGGVQHGSCFRFSKGDAADFHYKNLSGGEKSAFDLLLDIFVKRNEYQDAVYCIDEPEAHVATGIQGPLLEAMLELIPESSQLWIATHSIGFVRQAFQLMQNQGNVVFLDFSGHDLDNPVVIEPCIPNRVFWESTYNVALADLAMLIAPERIILCEGDKDKATKGFDANCYNSLFADKHPETLFISRGGSSEVMNSQDLINVLEAVAQGTTVCKLVDRDDMTCEKREELISIGILVLGRRELEDYLYDEAVLKSFLEDKGCPSSSEDVLNERKRLLDNHDGPKNIKDISRKLFQFIKQKTALQNLGNKREEFALQHLVPALRKTDVVYKELLKDIFPNSS